MEGKGGESIKCCCMHNVCFERRLHCIGFICLLIASSSILLFFMSRLHNENLDFFIGSNSKEVCIYNISEAHDLEHLWVYYFHIWIMSPTSRLVFAVSHTYVVTQNGFVHGHQLLISVRKAWFIKKKKVSMLSIKSWKNLTRRRIWVEEFTLL